MERVKTSRLVKAGRTSFTVYGEITRNNDPTILSNGFITFVCVDKDNKPIPHNLLLAPAKTEREIKLKKMADELQK